MRPVTYHAGAALEYEEQFEALHRVDAALADRFRFQVALLVKMISGNPASSTGGKMECGERTLGMGLRNITLLSWTFRKRS